ncbi:hypothetical protein ACQP3F_32530, partial [Escherichia coli]
MMIKVNCPEKHRKLHVPSLEPHSFRFCMCELESPAGHNQFTSHFWGHIEVPLVAALAWQVHCTCGKSGNCVLLVIAIPSD